jgi:MSHA biogenesis protein MshE
LLVGEIRDGESAEIALRAAMTGHMVLSTLHTNDAVTSALRLIDMNVDPYLVAASLKAVVAQRLVRRVCESCAEAYQPTANEMQLVRRVPQERLSSLRKGAGCPHCFNSGYRGRIGVFEILEIDHAMADALRDNSVKDFNSAAHKSEGYQPLSYSALEYALQGVTTLEEVMRVSALVEDEELAEIET